jgi:hypothetical protein
MGAALGIAGVPQHFTQPLQDTQRPGVFGCSTNRISELAAHTAALAIAFTGG